MKLGIHPIAVERSLLARLRQALVVARCTGGPIFIERPAAAHALQPTRGQCVSAPDAEPSIGWHFCERLKNCDRCPRFEAYRQGLAAEKTWDWDLSVSVGADQVKPDVRDSDGEGAEVQHFDHESIGPTANHAARDFHPHANPVVHPVAPGVEDSKTSAQQGDGQGNKVENGFGVGVHVLTLADQVAALRQRGLVGLLFAAQNTECTGHELAFRFWQGYLNALHGISSGHAAMAAQVDAQRSGYEPPAYLQAAFAALPNRVESATLAEVQEFLAAQGVQLTGDDGSCGVHAGSLGGFENGSKGGAA